MDIISIEQIETLIKKRKPKKDLMPFFIRDLIVEQFQDVDQFEAGKEEGKAEALQEIEDTEVFVDFEDPDFSHTLFAIQLLENVNSIEELKEVKQWLAIQECRTMPSTQQIKLF